MTAEPDKQSARPAKLSSQAVSLEYLNERTRQLLPVLAGIDLDVFDGELVSIVGPRGCGKTRVLNAVDVRIGVAGGEILVHGRRVTAPGPDRAMVFQHDALFPWRTVLA